ncbi:unnamed protein product [Closterium sp. NIES-65]|nr:unnamed protein product [Closterium sp. NIES-65]
MLPYLHPDLAEFRTVSDIFTHLRSSEDRFRAALKLAFLFKNPNPPPQVLHPVQQQQGQRRQGGGGGSSGEGVEWVVAGVVEALGVALGVAAVEEADRVEEAAVEGEAARVAGGRDG